MHEIGILSTTSVMTRVLLAMTIGGLAGYDRHQRHNFLVVAGMAVPTAGATSFLLLARHLAIADSTALIRALQTSMLVISLICVGIVWAGGVSAHTIRNVAVVWMIGAVGLTLATDIWWLGLLLGLVTIGIIYLTERTWL